MPTIDEIGDRAGAEVLAEMRAHLDVEWMLEEVTGLGDTSTTTAGTPLRSKRVVAWSLAAAALLLVVAVVAVMRGGPEPDIVPATPTAPATDAPSSTLAPSSEVRRDLGSAPGEGCGFGRQCPDEPGTYLWDDGGDFPLEVTVPEGWLIGDHHRNNLWLVTRDRSPIGHHVNIVFSSSPNDLPLPTPWTMPDATDARVSLEEVGRCEGIVADDVTPVELLGLQGWRLDYTFADGWLSSGCLDEGDLWGNEVCRSIPANEGSRTAATWTQACEQSRSSILLFDLPDGRQLGIWSTD